MHRTAEIASAVSRIFVLGQTSPFLAAKVSGDAFDHKLERHNQRVGGVQSRTAHVQSTAHVQT
jgi:hypothetical protein